VLWSWKQAALWGGVVRSLLHAGCRKQADTVGQVVRGEVAGQLHFEVAQVRNLVGCRLVVALLHCEHMQPCRVPP
jgi:hypothetical protein